VERKGRKSIGVPWYEGRLEKRKRRKGGDGEKIG